jgi:hypothetical protein
VARIREGAFNATLAREFETSEAAIRRFRKRNNINPTAVDPRADYTTVDGDNAEGSISSDKPILDDPDAMLCQRGLDPRDWEITHITVNEYQGPKSAEEGGGKVTYYQTKFTCVKKRPDVQLIAGELRGSLNLSKRRVRRADSNTPETWVLTGDQQAPFQDKALHESFQYWLEAHRPDRGLLLGDTVDFPEPSRHAVDPDNTATVNECIQVGVNLLSDYVLASEDTEWDLIEGNHDERLRNTIIDKIPAMYRIKQGDLPDSQGEDVLSVRHLLRLDDLRINYIPTQGKYDLTEVKLSDKFAARHGWVARKGSGSSALETLNHLGYSCAVGHTHRQSMVYKTVHDIDRTVKTLVGVETGCMCRVSQAPDPDDGRIWPNYAIAPDWQQGFATVKVWKDGFFKVDLATYVNGVLLYGGERF